MSWSGLFSVPAFAEQVKRSNKRCILLWLCGGPSQFETWDPKPGTPTGGPFKSIPTKTPGIHFSELMPKCASISDKLAVIRSMKPDVDQMFSGAGAGPAPASSDAPEIVRSATRTLVHLNRDGDGTPFTVIHGAGGNILFLSPLAREMRGDRPLVGMQAWGVDAADTPDPSITPKASAI